MGIRNLDRFKARLDQWGQVHVPEKSLQLQKRVAFLVLGAYFVSTEMGRDSRGRYTRVPQVVAVAGLLQLTPVDSGRARGNYQLTYGSPATGILEDFPTGTSTGSAPTSDENMRAMKALSRARPYGRMFIVNNLPYIVVLNDGGVNRVAHHMMERAISNARAALATRKAA
jgi:hypothetical protein